MLERQIMFKQLQEMQRRQQLQGKNQDYVSLTQAPPVQFAPTVNGSPFHDSQMLVLDNMQMVQRGESSIFQGFPSGFVLSQNHSNGLGSMGLSPPQFNMSSYTTNNPLEMSSIHPSDEVSSFMGRQGSFSSDQISMPDGSFLSNQVFQENNLYNFQSFNGDLSSLSYSPQGITTKRSASVVESDASLDPLELKFLYNTDDQRWESSFGTSNKMGSGGFESTVENPSFMDTSLSIQSGSWSALMQSAVGETSSSDTAVQEEWSGLSFQNPEPSSENQPSNFINSGKLQNDWVDRNLQNVSSPSSEPEQSFEKSHMKYSFPSFQQLGHHYLNQKDEFQSEAFHASGQHSSGHRYSLDSQKMDSRGNVEPASVHLGGSSDLHGQNVTAQSLPESQGFGFRRENADSRTPQSYSSLSLGNSSVPSLASHYEKDYVKNQYPAPSITSCMPAKLPEHRTASSHNVQPSGTSFASRHVGLPSGLPTPWPDISTQQDMSSSRAYKFSSSVFQSPGSACSSLETSSGAPYEQPSGNHFKHENNVGFEQQSEKDSFIHEGLNDLCNPTPLNRNTDTQQSLRKHYYSEVDGVASGSLITHTSQQPSDQAEQEDDKTPIFPARDISAFEQSLHHQLHHPSGKRFPFKYESIEYQQVDKARERLSEQKSILQDEAKNDALQVEAIFPVENKKWSFSQGPHKNQPEKASSAENLQSLQHMEIVGQDDSRNNSIGSYQASNIAVCQSQISLQMISSWFNNYGTLKNGQVLSAQQFSGLSFGKLQENNSIVHANSANASQGSEHLSPSSLIMQAKTKKRKIVAFDMVPWHKEVNCEVPSPQNISVTEFEWAQASNRRQEVATNEEIFDNVFPVVRAKRRLTFTTQFMQQVFRPAPAGILFEDACSNCEYVPYFTGRFALGDACNLNTGLPSDIDDVSTDKLKTSKRTTASDFLEVVKCLVSRIEKLEDDLSRWDRNMSIVDIKVESQELEKFSILNRFAKFHIKAHPSTVGPASSSAQSTVHKTTPQRYVIAVPMPKILPEVTDCLPL